MAKQKRAETRAERNIRWIEDNLKIPEGKDVGKPVRLLGFQKDYIRRIYDNPQGTRRGILSIGRKGGKSWLAACLLLLHLCGPESKLNGQLYSTAQSREQAAIVFTLALKMVRMSARISAVVQARESRKELLCPRRGTVYRALSKESKTALGYKPDFCVHDELGQVSGPHSALYDAMETASGASEDPLTLVISTQAASDGDLLSLLIDSALTGEDPRTFCVLHAAPVELDTFSDEALAAANPAFHEFQNAAEMRAMSADAQRMPSRRAEFENLILNRRIDAKTPFISREIWDENAGTPESIDGKDLIIGLDLSFVSDLTALVAVHEGDDGMFHVNPSFWLPDFGLREKAKNDKVPYDIWAADGFLNVVPGRTITYDFIARQLFEMSQRAASITVAFDPYKINYLKPHLFAAGFPEDFVDEHFKPHRQGFISMDPALRAAEQYLLENRVRHGNHPLLTMCFANAKVIQNADKSMRKLEKFSETRKIDGAVSLCMALGTIALGEEPETQSYLNSDGLMVL